MQHLHSYVSSPACSQVLETHWTVSNPLVKQKGVVSMCALAKQNQGTTLTDPNLSISPHGLLLSLSRGVLIKCMNSNVPPLKVEPLECEVGEPCTLSGSVPVQPLKEIE